MIIRPRMKRRAQILVPVLQVLSVLSEQFDTKQYSGKKDRGDEYQDEDLAYTQIGKTKAPLHYTIMIRLGFISLFPTDPCNSIPGIN